MASTASKLFIVLLRLIRKKKFLSKQLAARKFDSFTCPEPPRSVGRLCHLQKSQINGRNVFTLQPKNSKSSRHILYLHGGAYVQCFTKFHWQFLVSIANLSGCTITAPDYPLAPNHTIIDSFAMVSELYQTLSVNVPSGKLVIMGDSAGGGFALALAQKAREDNMPQPVHIILLSPWLDLTLSNEKIPDIDPLDPFLEKESLLQAGKLYAGDVDPNHYLLSPINGGLHALAKISLFVGSREILVADARKLKRLAESQGIDLDYYEFPEMVHAWMFLNFPESRSARQIIANIIAGNND